MTYDGPDPTEVSGFEDHTTNQRMELRAAVEALKRLEVPRQIKLHSDSAYLINGMNQRWYLKWEQNGWKNARKKPVENPDLWKELVRLSDQHEVDWVKIEGHSGIPANERCHSLVQLAIQNRQGISSSARSVEQEPRGQEEIKTAVDKRPIGETTENVFLSLVNQRGVFATAFDSEGLDGIAFDPDHSLFKVGRSPFFVQIKSRNSDSESYKSKNFPHDGIGSIESFAQNLGIPKGSLYFVVGFSKENDIRTIRYFAIPFTSLPRFSASKWYVFSVGKCEAAMEEDSGIFSL